MSSAPITAAVPTAPITAAVPTTLITKAATTVRDRGTSFSTVLGGTATTVSAPDSTPLSAASTATAPTGGTSTNATAQSNNNDHGIRGNTGNTSNTSNTSNTGGSSDDDSGVGGGSAPCVVLIVVVVIAATAVVAAGCFLSRKLLFFAPVNKELLGRTVPSECLTDSERHGSIFTVSNPAFKHQGLSTHIMNYNWRQHLDLRCALLSIRPRQVPYNGCWFMMLVHDRSLVLGV